MNHESSQVVYIQSPTQGQQPAEFPPRSSWKDCWDHSSSQVSIGTWAKQLKTMCHRAVSEVPWFQLLQPQSESSSTKMDQFPDPSLLRFFRSQNQSSTPWNSHAVSVKNSPIHHLDLSTPRTHSIPPWNMMHTPSQASLTPAGGLAKAFTSWMCSWRWEAWKPQGPSFSPLVHHPKKK